jgi:hypothetical protein
MCSIKIISLVMNSRIPCFVLTDPALLARAANDVKQAFIDEEIQLFRPIYVIVATWSGVAAGDGKAKDQVSNLNVLMSSLDTEYFFEKVR